MTKSISCLLVAVACCLGNVRADTLVGYWDLNNSFVRSAGTSGALSASYEVAGIAGIRFGTGTPLNLLNDSFEAGTSLEFFSLASVVEVGHITLSNLNFTGLSSPTVSFAVRGNAAFVLNDTFKIEYNIGEGWVSTDLAKPTGAYAVIPFTFSGGQLDNVSDARIRISFSTVVAVVDVVEFDNIQVNAVPEPGVVALLAGAGVAILLLRKRRLS